MTSNMLMLSLITFYVLLAEYGSVAVAHTLRSSTYSKGTVTFDADRMFSNGPPPPENANKAWGNIKKAFSTDTSLLEGTLVIENVPTKAGRTRTVRLQCTNKDSMEEDQTTLICNDDCTITLKFEDYNTAKGGAYAR